MFSHRTIASPDAGMHWNKLKTTVSKEKSYQATVAIGELVAEDMMDFAGLTPRNIDRVYVKFRDGTPMAAGIKKRLPHVDVQYIVSQLKQGEHVPISFWGGYDGYSNETIWFADPINATGSTAIESLRYLREHFLYDTALLSHVVANIQGIKGVQTTLEDFYTNGFMNYAYLSTRMHPTTGYLMDGLELTPDLGDKVFGTIGEDYSIYDIQKDIMRLMGTQAGKVELLKGTILHLIQLGNSTRYLSDRSASWITENWIYSALRWYYEVEDVPLDIIGQEQIITVINDLLWRDFLHIERRPWSNSYANVYTLTDDGVNYTSRVYLPIMNESRILNKIGKNFDFLIHLRPKEIEETIKDVNTYE